MSITSVTRRTPSRLLAAGAGALALGLALAGCSAGAPADESAAQSFGDVNVQLSWLKNHEFAGYYLGIEDGYFEDAGFDSVELTAGGLGGVSAEAALASGTAWIGIASPVSVAQANLEGADLVIVATLFQKNPFTLVSADTNPIESPEDLVGKTIAIADSSASNWDAFLAANDIDPADINRVPYGDANASLKLGQIDGFMGYFDGGAPLRAEGFGAQEFQLADFGLEYSGEAVVVRRETVENEPEKLQAFLTAFAQGWKAAFEDKDRVIDLVVNDYGKDQNYLAEDISSSWDQQATFILTEESEANGIGTISQRSIEANVASIKLIGVDLDETLFDPTFIAKVYADHPELIIGG
ncbi:ABC transporter substrate-binding protein [Leifsonia sp. H3M29-4]|uniref:ABC transporter substrate-binding protein n=1 Tax=Salinibacterium metalliresistens TaxID=3031321 RepID=UPI0023DA98A7|nr:ABC transporter substrate-binding protein [Salinibacterium metalliresistens]MDF1478256.1 ABC transporter substrate-binding protein [Salinibacterium metalliresistens]